MQTTGVQSSEPTKDFEADFVDWALRRIKQSGIIVTMRARANLAASTTSVLCNLISSQLLKNYRRILKTTKHNSYNSPR